MTDINRRNLGSIAISDLDNDGKLEFILGTGTGDINIFSYLKNTSTRKIYDKFRGDEANSGIFVYTDLPSSIDAESLTPENKLYQNYPNPFNSSTRINFTMKKGAVVDISVYNYKGELVKNITNNYYEKGSHFVIFESKNLTSGIYFYKMKSDGFNYINKMLFLK